MTKIKRYVYMEWPELKAKIRAQLADDKNPTICNFLWKSLPIRALQSHAMVSGDTMYAFHNITKELPTEYFEDLTDQRHWGHVPTKIGYVRFSTMGYQIIVIQWGSDRTEFEKRIPVAYVEREYFETLAYVGRKVLEGMMTGDVYTLVMKRARFPKI